MNNLISIGSIKSTSYRYKKHTHQYWEVTYYRDGEGINITDRVEYPFSAGTIICQPPHIEHEDTSSVGYKNIFFMVENFNFSSRHPIVFRDNATNDFLYILKQLYNEFYSKKSTERKIVNALLNVLYEYMIDFIDSKSANVYIDLVRRELMKNLSNPTFCIADALATVPMNEDYFRRQFKAETGVSPAEYLQEIRIGYAKQMLAGSSLPLKDVCQMCGYDDPYYFSRVFKKYAGVSPALWRKGSPPPPPAKFRPLSKSRFAVRRESFVRFFHQRKGPPKIGGPLFAGGRVVSIIPRVRSALSYAKISFEERQSKCPVFA